MTKYKEIRIRIPFPRMDEFFYNKNRIFVKKLKKQWEIFFYTHKTSNKKRIFDLYYLPFDRLLDRNLRKDFAKIYFKELTLCTEVGQVSHPSIFSFKKEKLENLNYLIRAKLVDFLGETCFVNRKIQYLLKIYKQHLGLENFFQIPFLNNSIVFSWIGYLLSEQIYQSLIRTHLFLNLFTSLSPFRSAWRKKTKFEIRNSGVLFSFQFREFLLVRWYKKKLHDWFQQVLVKTKGTSINQNSNQVSSEFHMSDLHKNKNKWKHFNQDRVNTKQVIRKKHILSRKIKNFSSLLASKIPNIALSGINTIPPIEQRYLKPFKSLLVRSKAITQVELIQKLNSIVRNWDTSVVNNIKKRKLLKLNFLLSDLLWQWGLARHTKQKAKWIRSRYWSINPVVQVLNRSREKFSSYG